MRTKFHNFGGIREFRRKSQKCRGILTQMRNYQAADVVPTIISKMFMIARPTFLPANP